MNYTILKVMNMSNQAETSQPVEDIRHLFLVLSRQFGLLQRESSQCCGVTAIQSHILYEMRRAHHLSLHELAERLDLDNSTMSRHIQGLVEKGYVQRQPDPKDRRCVVLGLTEQGNSLEKEIDDMMTTYIVDIFQQLPDGKIHDISAKLKLLTEAISKSKYCCKPPF
jgi:DNA-binding MarR family transcriptional regulator